MTGIFISHSSKNNSEAERLRDWLEEQGWGRSQVFLDLHNLKSGDRWREVLNSLSDCEAMIACLSDEWLASSECIREFTQAEERGKVILPVFVSQVTAPIPRFVSDVQIGDVSPEGRLKLRDQLFAKRITPQSFPWPPKNEPDRAVYRGLAALDVQDAAIFFGRDADILRGLDEIRSFRNGSTTKMLVILGASGAGKSSFLRAGLLARLARDEGNFVVLPVMRPERAAITGPEGLVSCLGARTGVPIEINTPQQLAAAFEALRAPIVERQKQRAAVAGEAFTGSPPSVVLAIDQTEELFNSDNAESAHFFDLLSGTLALDDNFVIVAAIRSDSYGQLQSERGLLAVKRSPFDLSPLSLGAYKEVIEGPAALAKPPLIVQPQLTEALLKELDADDALPLLAFTLAELQRGQAPGGTLTIEDYRNRLGGLGGAIRAAVEAVLGATPNPNTLALARRVFIPGLVRVDQDGVKRRVAPRVEFRDETLPLIDRFVSHRLLVSDVRELNGKTLDVVEVAHESILRQWPALATWIADDRNALASLESARGAAREWLAHKGAGAGADAWLVHRGERLEGLETILKRDDFGAAADDAVKEYIAACAKAEMQAARRPSNIPRNSFVRFMNRSAKNHLVIAGGGRESIALARNCTTKRSDKVFLITPDLPKETITDFSKKGVVLIPGEPSDLATLRAARAVYAAHIIAAAEDDDANLRIEAAARTLLDGWRRKKRGASVHVALSSPLLLQEAREMRAAMIRTKKPSSRGGDVAVEARPFSRHEIAARVLVQSHGVRMMEVAKALGHERPHIVMFGFDEAAEAVAARLLMSLWSTHFEAPRITILTPWPEDTRGRFAAHYPQAQAHDVWRADVAFMPLDWRTTGVDERLIQFIDEERGPASAVVVSTGVDSENIALALSLQRTCNVARRWLVPIFMKEDARSEFSKQFGSYDYDQIESYVEPFGSMQETLTRAVIIDGALDRGAAMSHNHYVRGLNSRGELDNRELEALRKGWEDVGETYRNANRATADHALIKMWDFGWVRASGAKGEKNPSVAQELVERAAELEHKRWVAERLMSGWRPGETRDNRLLVHSYLVPWSEYSLEARSRDAEQVMSSVTIARALCPAGFQRAT